MTVREFEANGLHLLDTLANLIRRVPADKLDWRPHEAMMTLGQLVEHTATSFTPVVELAVKQPPSDGHGGDIKLRSISVAEGLAIVEQHKALLSELLVGITEDQWLHSQRNLPWGASGSLGFCCVIAIDHAAGHRYQLFMYLKLLGQTLSTNELYGG